MTDSRPLAGLKVIDFTRYLAGPFCTQILGDYGAEVLKIEPVASATPDELVEYLAPAMSRIVRSSGPQPAASARSRTRSSRM